MHLIGDILFRSRGKKASITTTIKVQVIDPCFAIWATWDVVKTKMSQTVDAKRESIEIDGIGPLNKDVGIGPLDEGFSFSK